MARKAKRKPPNPPRGFERLVVRAEPRQIEALKDEALRRAQAKESKQPDASEIVRELLDRWMAKR